MGRFYQTSEAKFVDNKMFEAPHQLMAQVLQNKDKEIDTEISSATAYLDKLKAEVLQQDSPQLQEKIKEYEERISSITNNIRNNPLNYNKFSGDIQQLGRDVSAEWTTGKVGQMQQNKKFYDKRLEQIAEAEKDDKAKKGNNAEYFAKQRENLLKDYQQGIRLNPSTNKSENNIEQYATLYNDTVEEDFESKMKATKTGWERTSNGGAYFYNNEGTKEVLTREQLGDEFINWAKANPQALAAINDYSKVGVTGYEDGDIDKAKIIQKDKNGKETLVYNPDNYWGRKAISAGDAEINNTSSKNGIAANSSYYTGLEWESGKKVNLEGISGTNKNIEVLDASTRYNMNLDHLEEYKTNLSKVSEDVFGKNDKEAKNKSFQQVFDRAKALAVANPNNVLIQQKYKTVKALGDTWIKNIKSGNSEAYKIFPSAAIANAVVKDIDEMSKSPKLLDNIKGDFLLTYPDGQKRKVSNVTWLELKNNQKYIKKEWLALQMKNGGYVNQEKISDDPTEDSSPKKPTEDPFFIPQSIRLMPTGLRKDGSMDYNKNAISAERQVNGIHIESQYSADKIGVNAYSGK